MTGYESKRAMAQDKLAQPAQEPWPEEPVGHMAGGVQPAAPEVWMFQHDETGRVTCILNDGINTPELFLEMNPRYALIGSPNSLKRPWVDLTEDEIEVIEEKALTKQWAIRMALAAVKERNA